MPNLTFLAIENPLGVLGPKIRGVITDTRELAPLASVVKGTTDPGRYAVRGVSKYATRSTRIPQPAQPLIVDDTVDNREYVTRLLKKNGLAGYVRLVMCSSLNSMLKYMKSHYDAQTDKVPFDTVIVFGHGAPGGINLGLGKIGIGPSKRPGDEGYEERKAMREAFGLDEPSRGELPSPRRIRDLDVTNLGVWTRAFHDSKSCLGTTDEGMFHLFLMGCEVGAPVRETIKLHKRAAHALSRIIELPTCVAAPVEKIDEGHLDDLLLRLPAIRRSCAETKTATLDNGVGDKVTLAVSRNYGE